MATRTRKKKGDKHYVNNKEFLGAMVEWNKTFDLEKGDQVPPVTNYIAECFLKIATHLSYRPNFINYTFIPTQRNTMIPNTTS